MKVKKPFNSYKGDGKFAYACYVVDDSEVVFPLLLKLNDNRYRIRYDEGVQDEVEVDALRKHNIRHCETCLIFMSEKAIASQYFLNQLEVAQNLNAHMFVIYLSGEAVASGSAFFSSDVQSIRVDECSEQNLLDVVSAVISECQEPESEIEKVYTYDELLDETYPNEKNNSKDVFDAIAHEDNEKIKKSAESTVDALKAAKRQKKTKNLKSFLNALVVVGVLVLIAIFVYLFFGDQLNATLNPDEVVNFIPSLAKNININNLV